MGSCITYSILIAVISVVFNRVLIDEEMIFGFFGKLLDRMPKKLAQPLGECAYCLSGQISLWYYFFLGDYRIDQHIAFISLTILFTHLILWIYDKTA